MSWQDFGKAPNTNVANCQLRIGIGNTGNTQLLSATILLVRADCRARAFPRRPCGVERGNDYEFQKRKVLPEVLFAGLAG